MDKKITINELCNALKQTAEFKDDIFAVSLKRDGSAEGFKILNKGNGLDAEALGDFSKIQDIIFTNTITKERTTLIGYMERFGFNEKNNDGEVIIAFDGRTKTFTMIVVHNSNLGPALGGLREKNYSNFDSMLTDTLRLARAMTYKAALANTDTGGGKATRTVPLLRRDANLANARLVNFINEKRIFRGVEPYIIAEDSNTHNSDFDEMDKISSYVACRSLDIGGTGNPSPITAIGVYNAALVGAEFAFPDKKLDGKVVLLSGIGQVGYELARNYIYNGVEKVICAEMNEERIGWVKKQFERMGKTEKLEFLVYTKEQLKNQEFLLKLANKIDIFSPCALGQSINDTNINALRGTRLKLICGAENNQLADEEKQGKMLHEMGILYIPDYVVNAGGLINCSKEIPGRIFLISETIQETKNITNTVRKIIKISKEKNIPTYLAANQLAEQRFMNVKR